MSRHPTEPTKVAIVIPCHRGRVWVRLRRESGVLDGCWEFPGGKVRGGESPREAAAREFAEEAGFPVPVEELSQRRVVVHTYPDRLVRLHFFTLEMPSPGLMPEEGRWVEPATLKTWRLPAANRQVIEELEAESRRLRR
jgi:8-oxo-dGTP diphosphatase